MSASAIEVVDLWKQFPLDGGHRTLRSGRFMTECLTRKRSFWALREVGFELPWGHSLAIVGANGSGKSTLLRCLARILEPDRGAVHMGGRAASILEIGSGFHPELSGRENVYLNAAVLGLSKARIRREFDGIVDFADVDQFIDQPLKHYSSGMYLRLAFAVAVAVEPEILLIDEVIAVGDANFQKKCSDRLARFRSEGRSIVQATHLLAGLDTRCDQAVWLNAGEVGASGEVKGVVEKYLDWVTAPEQQSDAWVDAIGASGVQITSLELVDHAGEALAQPIDPGTSITIRIHYRVTAPMDGAIAKVEIRTWDGQVVSATTSAAGRTKLSLRPGTGTIEARLPGIPMTNATFTVCAEIWANKGREVISRHAAHNGLRLGGHQVHGDSGPLSLPGTWRHAWNEHQES